MKGKHFLLVGLIFILIGFKYIIFDFDFDLIKVDTLFKGLTFLLIGNGGFMFGFARVKKGL